MKTVETWESKRSEQYLNDPYLKFKNPSLI